MRFWDESLNAESQRRRLILLSYFFLKYCVAAKKQTIISPNVKFPLKSFLWNFLSDFYKVDLLTRDSRQRTVKLYASEVKISFDVS